jgi:translation elongation factor EF-4
MIYPLEGRKYLLNLIDTPVCAFWIYVSSSYSFPQGHVDFAWEVSRSLAACQGALLLVDATQGVQAQSLSVFHAAVDRGLTILPILNKVNHPNLVFQKSPEFALQIDLPNAQPKRIMDQMRSIFGIDPKDVLPISAKTGYGVEDVLEAIIKRVPAPVGDPSLPLKAFLFDSS